MANENTFLIGLGNQKCGTTWLHRYLSESKNFNGGFAKEYHIWDALDVPTLNKNMVGLAGAVFGGSQQRKRYRMQNDKDFYFDYFASLYGPGINVSADITPSYGGLNSPRLEVIRDKFLEREITTKAIVLIRDPVSRIKSAVRFNLDRKRYDEGINSGETDFFAALSQYSKSEHCRLRTSYHLIISRAIETFGEDRVYVGIFENMFENAEIERISEFCCVSTNYDYGKVHINKTRSSVGKDASLEAEIRKDYDEVYRYCYERFPSTRLLWN